MRASIIAILLLATAVGTSSCSGEMWALILSQSMQTSTLEMSRSVHRHPPYGDVPECPSCSNLARAIAEEEED